MKIIFLGFTVLLICSRVFSQNLSDTTLLQPVELLTVRAAENFPVPKTNLSKKDIAKNNLGRDLPFLLNETPSVIVHSDAGNAVGYTGLRIRGSDASRINVTLNGIPYNDAESQGTFFVDLPDIASSANNIQVQRGVGTSSVGTGSFGGAINISTNEIEKNRSIQYNTSVGSYNTFKNTLMLHSGLFGKHFTADARLSAISSDGYVDRASSNLRSYFASIAYTTTENSLRLNIFSGKEKTYQSWYGINDENLTTNRRYNSAGTEKSDTPYANETDNYTQTHYQLFYNQKINQHWKFNTGLFLTKGIGYYEQYKANSSLSSYGLPDYSLDSNLITETNLVRRLWLDNAYYGGIYSLHYNRNNTNVILGGSLSRYDGKHFGEIVRADVQAAVPLNFRWYDVTARKTDWSSYLKATHILSSTWSLFGDLQLRKVNYVINGFRNNPTLQQNNTYTFFNPKGGVTYYKRNNKIYFSFGRTSKEPNRDDFEAGITQAPLPETVNDFELGIENNGSNKRWAANLYYMNYTNQLVLTGRINDVGAYTRTNIPNSYRMGLELQGSNKFNKFFTAAGNISFSRNRVKSFTEYIDDYDNGNQQTKFYPKANLSFSPSVVSSFTLKFQPVEMAVVELVSKYVSRQYLDNTSDKSRSLQPYMVQDLRLAYTIDNKRGAVDVYFHVNNILSEKYEANGYTFSYYFANKLETENYYFPMAPVNFMIGVNLRIGKQD